MSGRRATSGWRRDLEHASQVLPAMAVLGFPLLLFETHHPAGMWASVGVVLLCLLLMSGLYLLLLMPLRRSRFWRAPRLQWQAAVVIVACSILTPLLALVVQGSFGVQRTEPLGPWLLLFVQGKLGFYIVTPAVLVCGTAMVELGLAAAAEAQRRELRTERMLARHREARLEVLRLQLHPHFLFNALNSVVALLVKDPPAATATLDRLRSLYERSLRSIGRELVPLSVELDWCREYLAIEHQRFSDRLRVEVSVDADAGAAGVPPLLLQPLIENAVRHGVGRDAGPAWIHIGATLDDDGALRLRVANNSQGRGEIREGFGLRHTRRRLAETYGEAAQLEVRRRDGCVEASVRLR